MIVSTMQVPLTLPEGRHSHSALLCNEGVFLIGGLDSSTTPLSSVLYLQYCLRGREIEWESATVDFSPPLPARYGINFFAISVLSYYTCKW